MRRIFLVSLLLLFSLLLRSAFAQTGLTFLQLGVTAREQAMANVGVASATGAAANYYNPALLNSGEKSVILFSQSLWLLDTYSSYAATAFNYGQSALGFSLTWLTINDIPIRTRPTESPEGTFAAQNLALSASYAYSFSNRFTLALTSKFLYERIFIDDATGVAFDLSGLYALSSNFRLAAALQNLGGMNALSSESSRLPTLLRAGAAIRLLFLLLKVAFCLKPTQLSCFPTLLCSTLVQSSSFVISFGHVLGLHSVKPHGIFQQALASSGAALSSTMPSCPSPTN